MATSSSLRPHTTQLASVSPVSERKEQPVLLGRVSSEFGPNASIFGVLASRRFGKKLRSRAYERRRLNGQLAPNYRTEPAAIPNQTTIYELMRRVVDGQLQGKSYTAARGRLLSVSLSDEIKTKLKELNYPRYKYIVMATIGENKDGGIKSVSRCLWNTDYDNTVSYTTQVNGLFCIVNVYYMYTD